MELAKQIRLNRIFSHPSKRLCSVAVDHLIGYQKGLPEGLVNVPETIKKLVEGKPDAITMLKGMAKSAWFPYAGRVPLIIQAICFTTDDAVIENLARPDWRARAQRGKVSQVAGSNGRRSGPPRVAGGRSRLSA